MSDRWYSKEEVLKVLEDYGFEKYDASVMVEEAEEDNAQFFSSADYEVWNGYSREHVSRNDDVYYVVAVYYQPRGLERYDWHIDHYEVNEYL